MIQLEVCLYGPLARYGGSDDNVYAQLLLEMDETTGTLQEIPSEARAHHDEKSALPLAAQLARPTTRRRSARA